MISKRALKYLLPLAILSSMLLTACGAEGGSTGGQTGTTPGGNNAIDYTGTITIWHNWEGDYLLPKKAIFDAYTKEHPQVKVELVKQEDLIAKSITAVKSNNGPDIIAFVDDNLGKLVNSKTVVALDEFISKDYVNTNFSKPAAEAVTFNEKIYGVPETIEAVTLMYNKAMVQESELPKTTEELLAFTKSYQEKNPGKYGIIWNSIDAYMSAPFFYGFGATYVTPDGKAHLDTPEALAAMKYIESFKPYMPKQLDYDIASSLFSEGKAAMIINGPWSYNDYASKGKIDVGFATLPTVSANNSTPLKPFVGVKSLWVTENAENVALSADLLKYFSNSQNQVQMVTATGEIPANLAALDDSTVKSNAVTTAYAEQAKLGTALPNTPYMSALWDPVAKALTAVWNGAQTPEAALAAAQTAATKGIEQITE